MADTEEDQHRLLDEEARDDHDDSEVRQTTMEELEVEENQYEYEEDLDEHAESVMAVLKPVSLTMLFVIISTEILFWTPYAVQGTGGGSSQLNYEVEQASGGSTGDQLLAAMVIAVIFLIVIVGVTTLFVLLYKYRCLKLIYGWLIMSSMVLLAVFGSAYAYSVIVALNMAWDWISFVFIMYNFAVVGVVAVFWHGPMRVNQGYLILISGLLAIFFSRMPEWTAFAVLAIVAVYDLFAVLCPKGPLKVLVETAEERQEPIPALLYNASVFMMMADEPPFQTKRKGIKLGLGDFVFYSVLIGRAAMYDIVSVVACFIGIVMGLFCTLILLAIARKALPALPISIAFGIILYFMSKGLLLPFVLNHAEHGVLI